MFMLLESNFIRLEYYLQLGLNIDVIKRLPKRATGYAKKARV